MDYAFAYASSAHFRLTPYGWGIFLVQAAARALAACPGEGYALPVSLSSDGQIERVHLWRPEAKKLRLQILQEIPPPEILSVPVQYSPAGGTYHVHQQSTRRFLRDRREFTNFFADYDESDQGGFI